VTKFSVGDVVRVCAETELSEGFADHYGHLWVVMKINSDRSRFYPIQATSVATGELEYFELSELEKNDDQA
jgi:hypothetical protein